MLYEEWEILPRCFTQRPSTRDLRLLQIWGFLLFDSTKIDGFIWIGSGRIISTSRRLVAQNESYPRSTLPPAVDNMKNEEEAQG
jgi:hypothetical protein